MTARTVPGSAGGAGATASSESSQSTTDRHVAGLDGIRAVAVVAVLFFHAGVGWFGGGMLGVDMFFALSGFLITSLLVAEHRKSGTLRLGRFYERRGALGPASNWFRNRPGWSERTKGRRTITLAGLLGAALCVWAVPAVSGDSWLVYHGGFAVMALATSAVIVAVVAQPRSLLAKMLALDVVAYVGRISYGLYLYHWPIFLMIDNAHTGLFGWRLLLCRLMVTGAVAVASYHLVELPVRQRRLLRTWRSALVAPTATAGIVAVVVLATVTPTAAESVLPPMVVPSPAATAHLDHVHGLAPGRTVHALILGDSLALTLGIGLSNEAPAWGVTVQNDAVLGCDLDPDSTVNIEGNITKAAQGCADWPHTWSADVRRSNPDVVAIELGRWEVSDRVVNGRWTRIGARPWDDLLTRLLDQAVAVVSKRGARVVLYTLPYVEQTTEQPNGEPWDINQPILTDRYNAIVRSVAQRHPGVVSVVDLNRLLDPAGHYTSYLDGVRVRNADNEHPSIAGGELLRPIILPELFELGLSHLRVRTS
jgi:hypothetical protein